MKNILFVILFIGLAGPALHAQNVRFVYGGDEDKPHGTQVISVGEYIKPNDRGRIDVEFGRCFVTNQKTFDAVKAFIRKSRYAVRESAGIADTLRNWIREGYAFYSIIGSDGSTVYLSEKYWDDFFDELRSRLRTGGLDLRVLGDF